MNEDERQRTERLVESIFAPNGTQEKTHDDDCFACDLAAEIAGGIAAYVHFGTRVQIGRKEHDGWEEPASLDYDEALSEDTRLDMAFRVAAFHLHQKLPGHTSNSPSRRTR
jgi:hypothetical protein